MNCILDASSASVKAHCYVFHLLILKFYFFLCPTEQLKGVGNYMLNIWKFFVFAFNGKLLLPLYLIAWVLNLVIMLLLARKGKRDMFPEGIFLYHSSYHLLKISRGRDTQIFISVRSSLFYIVNSRLGYTVGTDSEKY